MQTKISTPIVVVVILIALAVVGFFVWKSQSKSGGETDAKGIPLPPAEARPGANALSDLWKKGTKPPTNNPPLNPTQPPTNP